MDGRELKIVEFVKRYTQVSSKELNEEVSLSINHRLIIIVYPITLSLFQKYKSIPFPFVQAPNCSILPTGGW